MDELQLLRDCLPEQPPPSADVAMAVRERLASASVGDARRSGARRPGPRRPGSPRRVPLAGVRPARRELLLKAGLPAAGVTVAAAGTLAGLVGGPAPAAGAPGVLLGGPRPRCRSPAGRRRRPVPRPRLRRPIRAWYRLRN